MVTLLESLFPGLRGTVYQITSPNDPLYNCVAWTVGDTGNWWWPDSAGAHYWPPGIARALSLQAFHDLFAALGFVPCDHEFAEPGFEKVAVFALPDGKPAH